MKVSLLSIHGVTCRWPGDGNDSENHDKDIRTLNEEDGSLAILFQYELFRARVCLYTVDMGVFGGNGPMAVLEEWSFPRSSDTKLNINETNIVQDKDHWDVNVVIGIKDIEESVFSVKACFSVKIEE